MFPIVLLKWVTLNYSKPIQKNRADKRQRNLCLVPTLGHNSITIPSFSRGSVTKLSHVSSPAGASLVLDFKL